MTRRSFATAAHRKAPLALDWYDNVRCAWSSSPADQMTVLPSLLTVFITAADLAVSKSPAK